jgi:DNA replication protein DnaC
MPVSVTREVVDESGFVSFENAGRGLLFNLLAQRYERRSTIITSDLAFSERVKSLPMKAHN